MCPNVTLLAEHIPTFYSFSLGFFINCGSRDETIQDIGITHLIEHMLFKGTSRKSSLEIVKFIEGLGGSFDAYTTKENLIIVTKFLSEHIVNVFDLVAEILLESTFEQGELVKEKGVIIEEIKANFEDPSDYVFELFFDTLFKNHALSLPIAGNEDTVTSFTAAQARDHYHVLLQRQMVIAVSGNFDYKVLADLTDKRFKHIRARMPERIRPEGHTGKIAVQERRDINQVHCVCGVPGLAYTDPHRYEFSILNAAFGGGMSSRLFQGLREQEGLVYNVQSFIDMYSDCGVSGFYFACDRKNLPRVAACLRTIFADVAAHGFGKDEIELAKTYLTGNLLLSLENSTNRMLRMGREMLYLGSVQEIDHILETVRAINEKNVNALIPAYLDLEKQTYAFVGPLAVEEARDIFKIGI
ncbi:insulinase family protein [candidate division WOR-3 bacterium]|nr:insulinase family protein [candidate division WOR-3 bacterium]